MNDIDTDPRELQKRRAADWFAALRDRICAAFEAIEDALTDTPLGAKERKRAIEAMPPRLESRSPGCFAAIAGYFTITAYLFWRSRWWLWAVLAMPAAVALATVIAREVEGLLLLWESWLRHGVEAHHARAPRISVSFNYRLD